MWEIIEDFRVKSSAQVSCHYIVVFATFQCRRRYSSLLVMRCRESALRQQNWVLAFIKKLEPAKSFNKRHSSSYIAFSFNIVPLIIFVVRVQLYIWHINHWNVKTIAKFHQLFTYFYFYKCIARNFPLLYPLYYYKEFVLQS